MSTEQEACVVLCTAPDLAVAETLARTLIDEHLAACVNLLGPVQSIYRWNGAVESATEVQLVIKTLVARFPELAARVRAVHPYEVPELLMLRIEAGGADYLAWIQQQISGAR